MTSNSPTNATVAIAASSSLAAEAGATIVHQGGNAVDAAIAATLVSMCTEVGIMAPGGSGFITLTTSCQDPITIDAYGVMLGKGNCLWLKKAILKRATLITIRKGTMSLFNRIGGVIRSKINDLVSNTEDPEQVLEETVAAMEQEVIKMRQALAAAIATHKRTERQVNSYHQSSQKWYERAQMAVEKGNETLARDALMRRQSYQGNLQILETQLAEQRKVIQSIKTNLLDLENKYVDAKTKKNLYIARLRSAAANEKFQSLTDDLQPDSAAKAFEQIEAQIIELEAKSSALADPLEQKFLSLEDNRAVDQKLSEMKQKRLDSNS